MWKILMATSGSLGNWPLRRAHRSGIANDQWMAKRSAHERVGTEAASKEGGFRSFRDV
jgi:hypothetical protein